VWGTPFIPSHFSPGAWFWGVFASLIFLLLVLITAKDQICEHRPKCAFSCTKIIKNGLRGVRNGVRRCLLSVFLGRTQGFSNLKKNALGLVRAYICTGSRRNERSETLEFDL